MRGREVVVFALFHAGAADEGRAILDPVRHFGTPLGKHIAVRSANLFRMNQNIRPAMPAGD